MNKPKPEPTLDKLACDMEKILKKYLTQYNAHRKDEIEHPDYSNDIPQSYLYGELLCLLFVLLKKAGRSPQDLVGDSDWVFWGLPR